MDARLYLPASVPASIHHTHTQTDRSNIISPPHNIQQRLIINFTQYASLHRNSTNRFTTSNMTSHHRGPKHKCLWCPLASVITTIVLSIGQSPILQTLYFSSSSVLLRAFSALCIYSTFRHHPRPLDYLCAKFHFRGDVRCWASPWRKITYSVNQSINHAAYLMPREPKC